MRSSSSLPGLKYGTFFGGTSTLSPVFRLRPLRGSRLRRRKLPKPRSSIFSPRCSASMMLLKTVSTMTSECFFVRSETRETSSTSSALVILPFVIVFSMERLTILEMVAERRAAVAGRFLVMLPVRPELVRLQRADRQPDLPLARRELDDLHRVGLADRQLDLFFCGAAARMSLIELADVDQPFDPLVELDERAEVRHAHDLALDRVAHVMAREEIVPDVGRQLLEPERQPLVRGVDIQHHRLDDVALLQDLGRMFDALAPRHVADVDQAVDLVLDFDERAELGEVAHLAGDLAADRIFVREVVPRIGLDLFQAQ